MKKTVSMIDYIGCYSKNSGPVGHSLKVIHDYIQDFSDDLDMEIMAPEGYVAEIEAEHTCVLPYYMDAILSGKNVWQNILEMLRSFCNIRYALKHSISDIVWFYNVNQFLFMYLFLFGLHGKKVIITLFAREYSKSYHNFCLKKVLSKVSLIVSSNPEFDQDKYHCIYAPDYMYDPAIYESYCKEPKESKVVCVGTMNASKRIVELIEAFAGSDMQLEIYGLFYDKEYYQKAVGKCTENIRIEDRYLEYEEYLRILGSAQYCVLPYSMDAYSNFTSGVLLECMYVQTVPVTDMRLLSKMGINGAGYRKIEELSQMKFGESEYYRLVKANNDLVEKDYSLDRFRTKIVEAVNSLN